MRKRGAKKRGQVTIFIILAIVIVALIIFFLAFRGKIPILSGRGAINPENFLETCLQDKVKEAARLVAVRGGYINNENILSKDFRFEGENAATRVSYLCYSAEYYFPCVNQEPALFQHIKEEIKDYISEDARGCFEDLKKSLKKQGYSVQSDYSGFDVEIKYDRISVSINADLTTTKAEDTLKYENFEVEIMSGTYKLILAVQEAVNREITDCDFDYTGYMLLYPEFEIEKFITKDFSKIYSVKLKNSNEEFRFAVRGCVIPPGWVV